jgi:hypothetical protein
MLPEAKKLDHFACKMGLQTSLFMKKLENPPTRMKKRENQPATQDEEEGDPLSNS